MISRILKALPALLIGCALPSWADAATLLPQGEVQFFDNNGQVLSGGQIFFYLPGTTTPKSTYQNSAGTVLNTNPVILDSSGRAIIYGSGAYQETVEDANGNLIWSQITTDTSATGYSWAGTSGGTANAQTLTAPNFALTDGQIIGFIAGHSNTGALTFTVNGGSPINVVKATTSGSIALTGGEVVTGNQYQITYSATNGNFQLVSYPFSATVPITSVTGLGTGVQTALQVALNGAGGVLSYQAPVPTVYTSGSGTYTVPTGAQYLDVEMCGAGSGGSGGGTLATGGAGGAGGATTFGTLTANGGPATPTSGSTTLSTPATATGGDINIAGVLGEFPTYSNTSSAYGRGGLGAATIFGAGGSGAASEYTGSAAFVAAQAGTSPGSGGGGGMLTGAGITGNNGWGGNSGACLRKLITSPSATYSYAVGAAGAAGTAGTSGVVGAVGAPGIIRVTARFQ